MKGERERREGTWRWLNKEGGKKRGHGGIRREGEMKGERGRERSKKRRGAWRWKEGGRG